jgi:hypothetical protein
MTSTRTATPRQALLTSRVIAFALGLGPTLFALVAWAVGSAGDDGTPYEVLLYTFLGVAFSAALAALLVWRHRVGPAIEQGRRDRATGTRSPDAAMRIQSNAIIVWALAEGAALLGVVVYFLSGRPLTAVIGLFMVWLTLGLTWPKADWYGVEPRRA